MATPRYHGCKPVDGIDQRFARTVKVERFRRRQLSSGSSELAPFHRLLASPHGKNGGAARGRLTYPNTLVEAIAGDEVRFDFRRQVGYIFTDWNCLRRTERTFLSMN